MSKERRGVVHVYPDKKLARAGPWCMVGHHAQQQLSALGILIMTEGAFYQSLE